MIGDAIRAASVGEALNWVVDSVDRHTDGGAGDDLALMLIENTCGSG